MFRARVITREIKKYDPLLFAKEENGIIHIYRHSKEWRTEMLSYEQPIRWLFDNPYRVCSLTDTWGVRGRKVDWGVLPIRARLQAMDLWQSGIGVDDWFAEDEKQKKSKERELANTTEAFLKDFRSAFAKGFNDVNTSNMSKIDKRRIGDKKLWL